MTFANFKSYIWQSRTIGIGLVGLIVVAFYSSSTDLKLFADDYISWTTVQNTLDEPWYDLFVTYYNPEFYRPFEHLLIRANMVFFGDAPILYRWATIFGHILSLLAVYWITRRFRWGKDAALVAALYFGLSHANAMAALSNDAASQVFSTFCGMMALGFALPRPADKPLAPWSAWVSALWLLLAFFWKDAAISYVPALGVVLLWEGIRRAESRKPSRALMLLAPYALVLAIYFVLRLQSGATGPEICGPGRYSLCLGTNVIVNTVLFFIGLITPVGSSIVVLRLHSPVFMTLLVASTLAFLLLLATGIILAQRRRKTMGEAAPGSLPVIFIAMLAVFFPDVLMRQVSELYVYQPNALFAVLFGIATVAILRHLLETHWRILLVFLLVFLALIAWTNAKSIVHKTQRLRTNGIWAHQLMNEIRLQLPELPSRKLIVTNRKPGPAPFYSIYFMEGLYVLGGGKIFEFYYRKKIAEYRFYPYEQLERGLAEVPGRKVVLVYARDHVTAHVVDGKTMPPAE